MRIRVKDVLDLLLAKVSHSEILLDYPYLEEADLRACLDYESHVSHGSSHFPES
jgi:uncharacterized protein (DUF433 family)